jgi:hypothetical protein
MSHDYILTEDDNPAADASPAEDILELQLLTQEKGIGAIDLVNAKDHHEP